MLKVKNISKKYKNAEKYSNHNISLEVHKGEIFGLLGKNGAGKSTFIKSVIGVLPIDEGSIEIGGFDMAKNPIEAKQNLGYVPDNHAVYDSLTGREYVNIIANIYGVKKQDIETRMEELSKRFSIYHALDNQIRSYSHGMKQKICIVGSLIHYPKLWILDEPLIGLDPQAMHEVKEFMKEYAKLGNAIIFSSHAIDTVEKLCDRVAIINHGELLETFKVNEFKDTHTESMDDYFLRITKD